MAEIEQTNKVKILEELQKNGRISLSDLSEKTGLTRQTVSNIIDDMEKKKLIWGYTAIFDPKLIGKKPFIFLIKFDLTINTEDFLKIQTTPKQIKDNEEIYGYKTSMFLNGSSDMMIMIWSKDIITAKKQMNGIIKLYKSYVKNIELFDVIATFRNNGITNPKIVDEWNNLLI